MRVNLKVKIYQYTINRAFDKLRAHPVLHTLYETKTGCNVACMTLFKIGEGHHEEPAFLIAWARLVVATPKRQNPKTETDHPMVDQRVIH